MWIASGFLGALGLVPGMPTVPFLVLAGGAAAAARYSAKEAEDLAEVGRIEAAEAREPEPSREQSTIHDLLQTDTVELEVGYGLIPLIDEKQGGDLLGRIRLLRKQAALEIGILVPPIRIRDDVRLPPDVYVVKIRGSEVARGEVRPRQLLALDTGGAFGPLEGEDTFDPSFGMPAKWIPAKARVDAEAAGYTVVEASTVLATHLMETLKASASELLGRQDVKEMVEALKESYPALVDEVVPNRLPLGTLHRVLQRLLAERVPIRDMVTIMETLADASETTKDPEALTEHARRALSNVIGDRFTGPDGSIRGITLGPSLEAALMGLFSPRANRASTDMMDPERLTMLLSRLDDLTRAHGDEGRAVPIITPPGLRVGVRRLIEPVLPNVPVISLAELPAQANLRSVATWDLSNAA
jgi:flagellar biosynthesis protein FlhA